MYQVSSSTISEGYKASEVPLKEWKFQIDNGNIGDKVISDQLLDTIELARERAESEFLENSYELSEISFTTFLTNLSKNQTINIYGIPYLIKSLSYVINGTSIKTRVKAIRYD